MNRDATFEEGGERPLRLKALDADDLTVISAMVQDSVFPMTEMRWLRPKRRFAILLNRFRWEDEAAAKRTGRPVERVQSLLTVEDVQMVRSQGIDRKDTSTILSLLSLSFEPGEDGTGGLVLTLAGDGAIAVDVEALDVTLTDVTKPYKALSRMSPKHEA